MLCKDIGKLCFANGYDGYDKNIVKIRRLVSLRIHNLKDEIKTFDKIFERTQDKEIIKILKFKRIQLKVAKLLAEPWRYFTKHRNEIEYCIKFIFTHTYQMELNNIILDIVSFFNKFFNRTENWLHNDEYRRKY